MSVLDSHTIVAQNAWAQFAPAAWSSTTVWTLTVVVTAHSGGGAEVELYECNAGNTVNHLKQIIGPLTSNATFVFSGSRDRLDLTHFFIQVHAWGGTGDWSGSVVVEGNVGTTVYCEYGTRPTTGNRAVTIITKSIIESGLVRIGAEWAIPLVEGFAGVWLDTNALCGSGQPPLPTLTQDDFLFGSHDIPAPSAYGKAFEWIRAALWGTLCECKPAVGGGSAPIDFPTPAPDEPDWVPVMPNIVCDTGDLCSLINQIIRVQAQQQMMIQSIGTNVQLIQRQHVPFAYVPGPVHIDLSDSGSFAVQGILGLSVQCTTLPSRLGRNETDVVEYIELGHISFGSPDGFLEERVITHNPHLFLDVSAAATFVNYDLVEGVVADIRELIREP